MARFEVQGPDGRTYEVEAPSAEAAAAAIAQMPQQQQPVGVGQDVAMGAASGVARGTTGLLDLPGQITGFLGRQAGRLVEPVYERITGRDLPTEFYMQEAQRAIDMISPFAPQGRTFTGAAEQVAPELMTYEPQTFTGRVVQRVGENLPAAAALPVGGLSLPVRVAGGAVLPGITGQAAEEAAGAMGASPLAAELTGLGAEMLTPNIFAASGALARRGLIGSEARAFEPGSERAQAVATLRDAGIEDITLGQQLGSERLMRLEGVEAAQRGSVLDLNEFVMRHLGSDDVRPTATAMGRVADRLGAVFDEAEAVISVVPSQQVGQRIADAATAYTDATGLDRLPSAVNTIVENIRDAIQSGRPITQENLQQWRPALRRLMERADRTDIATANGELAGDLMEALNEIVIEGARAAGDPGLFGRLMDARIGYRDYIDVLNALRRSGGAEAASGIVTPQALYGSIQRRYGNRLLSAREGQQLGPLAEVARASREVLGDLDRVPAGGVRFSPTGGTLATVAGLTGMSIGDLGPLGALALPAGAYLAPQVGQAAMRSRAGQRALTGPMGIIPALAQRGMPLGAVAGLGGLTGPQ
jgi:hypothetical protein